MYAHRYTDETNYQVIEYYPGGSRILPHDQHDYLAWVALGNTPTIEAAGRFLSVVDGVLVVDPNKDTILAAEEAARQAEIARQAAKAQAILDNLPSWAQVNTAVDNIANLADAKAFLKKLARITYWLAKDTEA
jgi:cell division protein FtsB